MEKLIFERVIDLNHALKELTSISVNENFNYLDDAKGKRAVGSIQISGEFLRLASKERFNDEIEIDVLAPFDRLEDNQKFYLEIQDFDYHIQNGNLNIEIQVNAHGVGQQKERHIIVDVASEDEQEILKEIQEIVKKNELIAAMQEELKEKEEECGIEIDEDDEIRESEIEEETEEMLEDELPVVLEEESQVEEVSIITEKEEVMSENENNDIQTWQESESVDVEDLFDDDEMAFVTYPIYVVQVDDSYEKIAKRYQIEEKTLKEYNQHISLKPHQLLIIPPR